MHGAVLLDKRRRTQHSLEILVPGGYETRPEDIVGHCLVCGSKFYRGEEEAWQRHVGDCARAHMDDILNSAPSVRDKGTPFEPWDPEVEQHMLGVGRRMLAEGRREVLPHERAGFS